MAKTLADEKRVGLPDLSEAAFRYLVRHIARVEQRGGVEGQAGMINIDQLSEKSFICLRSDVDKLFHRDRLISSMSRFVTVQAIGTQMVCFEWHTPIYSTDEQAIPDDAMRQLLNATQSRRPNARKNKGQKKKSDGKSVKQSVATAVRSVHHAEVESDGEWDQECVLAVSASAWRTNKQIWLDTGATNHVIGRNH